MSFLALNITESLHLGPNSTITCDLGATIDLSCLSLGMCPDLFPCNVRARTLEVYGNPFGPSYFRVGNPGDVFPGMVMMGDSNLIGYTLSSIVAYAQNLVLEGTGAGSTVLRAKNGGTLLVEAAGIGAQLILNSVGSAVLTAQTGSLSLLGTVGGVLIQNLDSSTQITLDSFGSILANSGLNSLIRLASGTIQLAKLVPVNSVNFWITTDPSFTYLYNLFPLITVPNSASIHIYEDLIIETDKKIISKLEFLSVGPNLDVGAGRVTSNGANRLALSDALFNKTISMEGPVQNLALLPLAEGILGGGYVLINDENGTRITNGPLLVDTGMIQLGTGNFNVSDMIDAQAPIKNLASLPIAEGNVGSGHVLFDDDVRISGNLLVNGSIFGGMCLGCVSDREVKENILSIPLKESMQKIDKLQPVSYLFKEWYQKKNPAIHGHEYHGLIAQDVKRDFPYAVHTYHDVHGMKDFHTLDKDALIPDLINAVKYLYKRVKKLSRRRRKR